MSVTFGGVQHRRTVALQQIVSVGRSETNVGPSLRVYSDARLRDCLTIFLYTFRLDLDVASCAWVLHVRVSGPIAYQWCLGTWDFDASLCEG